MTQTLWTIQERIAEGEQQALAQLYTHFHKKLQHFSSLLLRSPELAEEVVEDVFVKLWSNRSSIKDIDNITVYLYVAVKNTSLNKLSRKAKDLVSAPFDFFDIDVNDSLPDPHDMMVTGEMMKKMHKVIEALPPRCKMIFKLIREDGLKYKEVSQILNISVNTIDAQMAIAVKRICTALQIDPSQKKFLLDIHKEK